MPKGVRPPPPQAHVSSRISQYDKMLEIIERTPALQTEWERFSMLLKLSCEPNEIEVLFPQK